jgi:hypothetical protein
LLFILACRVTIGRAAREWSVYGMREKGPRKRRRRGGITSSMETRSAVFSLVTFWLVCTSSAFRFRSSSTSSGELQW